MKLCWMWMGLLSASLQAEVVQVKVPGMVCQMCVQGMKKSFKKYVTDPERDIIVDLETKLVTLKTNTAITDAQIKQGVIDAGYTTESIARTK